MAAVSRFAVESIDNETKIAIMFHPVRSAALAPGRTSPARLSLVLDGRDQAMLRGAASSRPGQAGQAGQAGRPGGSPRKGCGSPTQPPGAWLADGVTKTTLDDVAREAGCSRATVYRTFPGGKEEVVAAVVDTEVARLFSAIAVAMGAAESISRTRSSPESS